MKIVKKLMYKKLKNNTYDKPIRNYKTERIWMQQEQSTYVSLN